MFFLEVVISLFGMSNVEHKPRRGDSDEVSPLF
jgi:hypothetical protein